MRKTDDIFKLPVMKEMLLQEKNIMVSLQGCEWFVQLEASWYDSHNIYFAMTYYPTDLESEIIRCEKLPAERARFYMAEMIIALEELHKRGIVHRDVKAANLLIGADGHIVLADFGLSKDFGRQPTDAERCYQPYWPFRTDDDVFRTPRRSPEQLTFVTDDICGSEVEMPPEIILEEYYSFGVDFWASGITLYLMVTGRQPWSEEKEKSIRQQILEDEVEFSPEEEVREECRDFIRQMLRKEPTERLRIGLDMVSHPTSVSGIG
jgi:serine/threonine protein kinase